MHDDRITQRDVNWSFADELAWKRSGFKNRESLEQAVRDLPLEKKVEMLVELNMSGINPNDSLATMLFEEKQEFLLSLGKKTWVDANESYEYAKETYKDDKWSIDKRDFQPMCVFSGTHTNQMNSHVMSKVREKRKVNE